MEPLEPMEEPTIPTRVRLAISGALLAAGAVMLLAATANYAVGLYAQSEASTHVPAAPLPEGGRRAPRMGEVVARLEIPRLAMNLAVFEGVSDAILRKGPGHLPSTDLPGAASENKNCVIAGHRDSFFRKLGSLRRGDDVVLRTASGAVPYRVFRRRIVSPNQSSVLDPTSEPRLTLVTCYPFDWLGPAPYRLILEARPAPSPPASARSSRDRPPSNQGQAEPRGRDDEQDVGQAGYAVDERRAENQKNQ